MSGAAGAGLDSFVPDGWDPDDSPYVGHAGFLGRAGTHRASSPPTVVSESMGGAAAGVSVGPGSPDWESLALSCRGPDGRVDPVEFMDGLLDMVAAEYSGAVPGAQLVEFAHGPGTYLLDRAGEARELRTVLAVGTPSVPDVQREASYQRGYPAPERIGGRPVDRGHFLPFSAAGLYGPNLFVQDRALNRGWSADGRAYRALERAAVAGASGTVMFVRPWYGDDSAVPEHLDVGVLTGLGLEVRRFRNRFDTLPSDADQLNVLMMAATDGQLGALGEETAAVFLEEELGATIVSMGDAGMPRDGGRQDLDLVAVVEGELVVFEVKTRFTSRLAGRRTRAGHLLRPRLRRPGVTGGRQGSQPYVAARLAGVLDVGEGFEGVEVRVLLVDLKAMLVQQFSVNDAGTRLMPLDQPAGCRDAAGRALRRILDHRGHL